MMGEAVVDYTILQRVTIIAMHTHPRRKARYTFNTIDRALQTSPVKKGHRIG